ncbi:hypothetical protein Ade02nite_03490 [Paractinoplanes deccanensis]|uniref:NADAR domain-containing protein n=1 Tax=Paractinoplanes deccanensis TaxID=113561 RepID=A0ABQ3XVF3_9ACTN|nr:NADAR family protein [Actinoplanes deccanensis]GID71708.1 hypothetical protein Ade02nite_03490 [Actinoplanes deccanensis]
MPKFLFFWGHESAHGCLSQWYPSPFEVDGVRFATAEHYMMWSKAILFGDKEMAGRVLEAGHPHAAKKLGGLVAGFEQQVWDEHRLPIVVAGNLAKFTAHDDLREFLLGTALMQVRDTLRR